MQIIPFVSKCLNSSILYGAVRSKAFSARRYWIVVMCAVGETFYSLSIFPCSWNNWLFIPPICFLVLAVIVSKSRLEAFWPIAFERCREKWTCIFQNNSFFFYLFRLNRAFRYQCLFINGYDVTKTVVNCQAHLHNRLLLWLVQIPLQCYLSSLVILEN